LTAAPLVLIIEPSEIVEVFGMRIKKILLFALGAFAVVAALLSVNKPKE
jgi:hypothetical protein